MKISMSLSPSSIDRAIQQLEEYKRGLEQKAEKLRSRLVDIGYQVATVGFGSAIYDGTNDVSVETNLEGNNGKVVIKASGEVVMFIEFGAGVAYPDSHPQASEMGMTHGTYGKGYGRRNTWAYYGDNPGTNGWTKPERPGLVFTHGNPANMPMYNAKEEMRQQIETIAKEVFRS